MKLYVIPTERLCNAKCKYCITNERGYKKEFLKVGDLERELKVTHYEKIEVTGGGEPSLHPHIDKILEICNKYVPTQIYTNGTLKVEDVPDGVLVCLSRAHWDGTKRLWGLIMRLKSIKIIH